MATSSEWDKRFMSIANEVAKWSSCCRQHVGAVIVKDNRIIATGYNGAPAGIESCKERGFCYKNSIGIEKGNNNCYAIHAEQNALLQAAKLGIAVQGATLYCTHQPCNICLKSLLNAGITIIHYVKPYRDDFASKLIFEYEQGVCLLKEPDDYVD